MIIYGRNAVQEALKSQVTIEKIMAEKGVNHPIIAIARTNGVKIQFVERMVLDKEIGSSKHQGFVAVTTEFDYSTVEDIMQVGVDKGEPHFIVILDGVEDPHNLGSILRVCECAGVHGIIIGKNRAVGVNETVMRISSGAAEHVKVARVVNINNAITQLKESNVWVYGADMTGDNIYTTNLKGDIALVVGGEGVGVSKLTRELCDKVVALPIRGQVNSLNASVAAGVVVYEALRQRLG